MFTRLLRCCLEVMSFTMWSNSEMQLCRDESEYSTFPHCHLLLSNVDTPVSSHTECVQLKKQKIIWVSLLGVLQTYRCPQVQSFGYNRWKTCGKSVCTQRTHSVLIKRDLRTVRYEDHYIWSPLQPTQTKQWKTEKLITPTPINKLPSSERGGIVLHSWHSLTRIQKHIFLL